MRGIQQMNEHRGESDFESDKYSVRQDAQERHEQSVKRGENKRRKMNRLYPGASQLRTLYTSGGFLEEEQQEPRMIKVRIVKKKPIQESDQTCVYSVLRNQLDELAKVKQQIEHAKNELKQLQQKINKYKNVRAGITTQELWNYCSDLNRASKGKFDDNDK